ncbi:putative cytochrome P450 [Pseudomassariella vexata]|uniref:Putative cytochrome P450 n=1 Tax=Pseudomassariella vexata TaxID=1141098 RepID=A0A1Y2EAC0_9PEZI|nr:putative cytochrome P450 [Pseudomassariella vexata]ORY67805.1 putative cytochrome P450 [Pseudomassariella vexata]
MAILEHFVGVSVVDIVKYFVVGVILYQATVTIYSLLFHPLRHFPGPLLQGATSIPYVLRNARGYQAFHTQKLHDVYGPVVRIATNHLSFTDPIAWKDIYGHRLSSSGTDTTDELKKTSEMMKSKQFSVSMEDLSTSIINAPREEHSRLRRALSHGFSDASIRAKEAKITRLVDVLIQRLKEECSKNAAKEGTKAFNMESWYNWATFDIIGSLVFGESFGCLQSAEYHPWIEFITRGIRFGAILSALSYLGLRWVVSIIYRAGGARAFANTRRSTDVTVRNRLKSGEPREDLFEAMVKKREEFNMSFEKLSGNAVILVLAGSEMTATTLSDVLQKLNHEVRSFFSSVDEITIASVNQLTYMLAVLNETLRVYPPVTSHLVRIVPAGEEQIAGHFIPGGTLVEVQQWSTNHSKDNWLGNKLEALQAFSVGPWNCIGRNLSYAEMRLILARIIYHFDMTLAEDSERWIERQKSYALWDRIPLNVHLTPIK